MMQLLKHLIGAGLSGEALAEAIEIHQLEIQEAVYKAVAAATAPSEAALARRRQRAAKKAREAVATCREHVATWSPSVPPKRNNQTPSTPSEKTKTQSPPLAAAAAPEKLISFEEMVPAQSTVELATKHEIGEAEWDLQLDRFSTHYAGQRKTLAEWQRLHRSWLLNGLPTAFGRRLSNRKPTVEKPSEQRSEPKVQVPQPTSPKKVFILEGSEPFRAWSEWRRARGMVGLWLAESDWDRSVRGARVETEWPPGYVPVTGKFVTLDADAAPRP